MSDEVQPGTKIDAEVWEQFREEVRERHGVVRGHLKTELENALRQYSGETATTDVDIERRLARIEAQVGVGVADGGADTSEPAEDTHTPMPVPDEKPHPKSASQDKLAWLTDCYISAYGNDDGTVDRLAESVAREVIEEEYDFNEDIIDRYVARMIDTLGLVKHPDYSSTYIPEAKYDDLMDERRAQRREEAAKETDTQ